VHRRRTATAGLAVLALALTACSAGTATPGSLPARPAVEAPAVDAPAPVASPVAAPPSQEPSASPTPEQEPSPAAPAKPSYDVVAAQRTLADLGYYLGAADGRRGSAFRSAVMAFQKVQGLRADGAVGPATLKALAAPRKPVLKASSPSNRVEVDLTKQVLYVVKGGAVKRILPVSSGNGASYEQKDGSEARALTPTGFYRIQRRIVGVREADLGTLYDPQYFYKGWAIHGSNSVPAVPASHGCVRVTRADAKWLLKELSIGMSVYLYGGKHVFSAGSSAPGTDAPTGDTGGSTEPTSTPKPSPKRTSEPTPSSSPTPTRTATGSASPKPTASAR
jgi:lipoprotein-anchoring transpeptidase ErfK/SrfK